MKVSHEEVSPKGYILATAAAYGNHYTTDEMIEAFHKQREAAGDKTYDKPFVDRVLRACGFDMHSVALPKEDIFRTMTREEYLSHRSSNLLGLAQSACEKAIADWGGDRGEITHLYWGTMTGAMHSPTIDIHLTQRLGLHYDVQRTSIEGMGCLTGFRLMNLARSEVINNPKSRVLVIEADLRSAIGNSLPPKAERSDIVSACLFRDAASAVIMGSCPRDNETPLYEIIHGGSRIVKEALDLVDYCECDGGSIRLHLSKELPYAVGREEPAFVKKLLSGSAAYCLKNGMRPPPELSEFDIVCHTGGPLVLKEVAKGLGADHSQLASSWAVMRAHGNLSGASNMAVLDHHNRSGHGRIWTICLLMGPGACLEGVVLQQVNHLDDIPTAKERKKMMTVPLGDPNSEQIASLALKKMISEGHESAKYPAMWMNKSDSIIKRMKKILKCIMPALLFAGLVVSTINWSNGDSVAGPCVLLSITITSLAAVVVDSFSLDHCPQLMFLGVFTMFFGATINVVVGPTILGEVLTSLDKSSEDESLMTLIGTTLGFSLLALGVQIFCFASFILLGWQFMIGSILLSAALCLKACAVLIRTLHQEVVVGLASAVEITSVPLFIIALILMGIRSFYNMRKPWLCPPNFPFYGTMLFGLGEVVGGSILTSAQFVNNFKVGDWFLLCDGLTRGCLFIATTLLLLDAAMMNFHLERTVEYSYPAMTKLIFTKSCITIYRVASVVVAVGAMIGFIVHTLDAADNMASKLRIYDVAISIVFAMMVAVVYVLASRNKYFANTFKPRYQQTGFLLLLTGYTLRSVFKFSDIGGYGIQIISTCCGICGALFFAFIALKLPMGQRRFRFLHPVTYLNILHPGNYFLLSKLFTSLCFLFWVFELDILGYLALMISAMIMQCHLSMAHQVYMITETQISNSSKNIMPENITNEHIVEKETMEEVEEVDVLITGAGPTGLLLASILGKHGVSVMLVEARPKPVDDARFTVVNSASMEILAKNLDPDLFKELRIRAMPDSSPYGSILTTGLAHSDAKVLRAANTPSRKELMKDVGNICDVTESRILGSKHAAELPIRANQSHQEQVLKKQAERIDAVQLRYGHRLLGFKFLENNTIVEAKVCPCSGESLSDADQLRCFTIRSKYIVGSDGPSSTVAKGLGLNFDGFLNVGHTRSLLVRAPGLYENVLNRLGGTFMYQIIRKNFGFCGLVASDPKKHLWSFLQTIGKETITASSDKICREFLGTSNHEIVSDRNWYWNFFVAREWRKGPGFIAGDAAHSWPPFGALGGNTGYGDAANLAWKLASVCNGVGGEVLLDSYETERRQTTIMTALFVLSNAPRQDMMNKFIIPFADSPFVKQWMKGNYYYANSGKHLGNHFSQSGLQLGTKYNKSPIISSHQSLPDDPYCEYLPCIHGGARLPLFHIRCPEDSSVIVSVHDLIHTQGYTLFVIVNNNHTNLGQRVQRLNVEALKINFEKVGVPLSVQEINTNEVGMIQENKSGTRATALELWNDQLIILVRPDHVTAWHLALEDTEDDSENIESYLVKNCQTVVATVTGLSPIDGSDLKTNFDESDDKMKMMSYQRWLTKQFRSHLRPYGFLFPKAVPIHNETKDQAMARVKKNKNKDKEYDFTTRITAEKNKASPKLRENTSNSEQSGTLEIDCPV